MKNNHQKIYLLTLGVIGALIITLGITYAYWNLTKEQTGVNVVNTDCFSIDFTGENDIILHNTFPLNDTELANFLANATPYHFTITNECSSLASATINLESLNANANKQLDDEWIDAILYETDYHRKINVNTKLTLNPNNDENKVIADAIHAYSLKKFTLKANETKDYYLLLYMDQNTPLQEDIQNGIWKGKITLSAEYKVDQFANSGTLRSIGGTDEETGMWQFKDELTKIVIEPKKSKKEASEGQIIYGPFDESYTKDGAIESYVICDADDTNCIEYIQGDGGIKLNNNSDYLFHGFTNVTEIEGIKNIDASNAIDMTHMFSDMAHLQELDLSSFDTSNVKDMKYMFLSTRNLKTLILRDNFNTSNVTNMNGMFNGMRNLETLILGENFDTSNVENMSSMFFAMSSMQELDLSHFDTRKVKDMSYMFYAMNSLKELDLSSFDTSSVTNMNRMFSIMNSLQKLNISSFNTSSVKDMSYMFQGMSRIQSLDLSSFDTINVTNMNSMFYDSSNLTEITYSSKFIHNDETDTGSMFENCPANRPDATVHSSWEGVSFN